MEFSKSSSSLWVFHTISLFSQTLNFLSVPSNFLNVPSIAQLVERRTVEA